MNVTETLTKPLSQQLLSSNIPARLAYTGVDGDPRVIPIAFEWTGSELLIATLPKSAKVKALQQNPRVAITIDTQGVYPPQVLLIRGAAKVEPVEGIPDAYINGSGKLVPEQEFEGWEAGVRALYDQMVLITIEPDWAKLLDFETTIPKAVEDVIKAHGSRS